MADVLDRWRNFPATAAPRPIVLVDHYLRVQAGGFETGEAKIAFINGAITLADGVHLPSSVQALLPAHRPDHHGVRLQITAVNRQDYSFRTDRGRVPLASYALTIPGAHRPVIVLDPDTPVWWPPKPVAENPGTGGSATIDPDQRTLHVWASGSVLTEFVRCDLAETDTAVLAIPVTTNRPAQPGQAIAAVLIGQQVTATLDRPLAGRVLINAGGDPIAVEPSEPRDPIVRAMPV